MKKTVILILLFSMTIFSLFALNTNTLNTNTLNTNLPFVESGVLIPVREGEDLYWKFDALFVIAGKAVPSTSRPWTVSEARNYLNIIDPESLSQEAKALYYELYDYLFVEDKDTLALTVTISPEAYAHTNVEYNREEFWNYGFSKRNHLASVSLDNSTHGIYGHLNFSSGKGLVSAEDAQNAVTIKEYVESLGKTWGGVGTLIGETEGDKYTVVKSQKAYTDNLTFNLPFSSTDMDINIPRRYYLDYSNSFMSFGMYKAQKAWGYNRGGNFIFDTHNDYYHTATLKTFSKKFNFEYTIMMPETYRGGNNYYLDDEEPSRRVFAAHRVEIRLWDCLNVVLSENTMYRFTGYFDASLLNPANFYHNNVNNQQFNSLAHVEFEWSMAPSWLLYGSWVIDQGSFPGLEDRATEDQAMGYSLGLEYSAFLFGGLTRLALEGIYTNPALYRPTGASDFIINYNVTYNGDVYFRYPFYTYIGYKYGGDTISLRLDASYKREMLYLYGNFELRFDGEFTLYDEYHQPMLLTAPSGDYDVVSTFNLGAQYQLKFFSLPMTVFLDTSLINSKKHGFDAQFALGAKLSYTFL